MEKALAKDFSQEDFYGMGNPQCPFSQLSPFPLPPFRLTPRFSFAALLLDDARDGSKWAAGAFTAEESPKPKKSIPSKLMLVHNLSGWE